MDYEVVKVKAAQTVLGIRNSSKCLICTFPIHRKFTCDIVKRHINDYAMKHKKVLAHKNSWWMPEMKSITDLTYSAGKIITLRKIALKHLWFFFWERENNIKHNSWVYAPNRIILVHHNL